MSGRISVHIEILRINFKIVITHEITFNFLQFRLVHINITFIKLH